MNGDPVWMELTGWLLVAFALFGGVFVILLVVDTVRGRSGLTPVVHEAGKSIEQSAIVVLLAAIFFLALGVIRP